MNKIDRALIAETLKGAKRYLSRRMEDNKYEHICHAVHQFSDWRGRDLTKRVIAERLGAWNDPGAPRTVYCWLLDAAKVEGALLTYENVQKYRHRWVDALIKEFSA